MKLNKENPSPDVFDSKMLTEGWATPPLITADLDFKKVKSANIIIYEGDENQ